MKQPPAIKTTTLNDAQQRQILRMRSRVGVTTFHGVAPDGRAWNDHLADSLDAMLTDETPAQKKAEFLRQAATGDQEAKRALNALRIETVSNFVMGTADFLPFFKVVSLGEADVPAIQNETRQEIKVSYVAQDGEPRSTKVVKPQTETLIDLYEITTDKVGYRLRDIYRGRVAEAAQRTFDLGYEMAMELDAILYALLVSNIGAFTVTGAKVSRTYNASRRIRSGVLPTTNALAIPSVTGSTKFGFTTLKVIIDYAARFARAFPDGDLIPTGDIIVPADQIEGIIDGITPTSAAQNQVAQDLQDRGYYEVPYLGKTWRFKPNNIIPTGYCWPVFNKPVGTLYLKASMDTAPVETDIHRNWEERWQSMVFGAAIPSPNKVNLARVEFNTTH